MTTPEELMEYLSQTENVEFKPEVESCWIKNRIDGKAFLLLNNEDIAKLFERDPDPALGDSKKLLHLINRCQPEPSLMKTSGKQLTSMFASTLESKAQQDLGYLTKKTSANGLLIDEIGAKLKEQKAKRADDLAKLPPAKPKGICVGYSLNSKGTPGKVAILKGKEREVKYYSNASAAVKAAVSSGEVDEWSATKIYNWENFQEAETSDREIEDAEEEELVNKNSQKRKGASASKAATKKSKPAEESDGYESPVY